MADIDEPKSMNPDSGAASVNLSSSNSGGVDIGATQTPPKTGWELAKSRFEKLDFNQKLGLGAAAAFLVAVLLAISITSSKSDYRVLFSNINEADGSQIIASLTQMNVPYKFTPGGGAILVPEKMVYETRLKLAGQGLPKSGYVGFEVLENQKLGTSQFVEQVNYQRAVEGELARSIGSISQIKSARVHLAVPKQTAFVREQDRPTASVVLQMYPGRFLEPQQVIAIQHLVSSSIPKLAPSQVTVVDQDGILLSQNSQRMETLDSSQLKYVAELENALAKRVSMLMDPIAGKDSVRAQVTVDMNFDERTRTEETFGKNSAPNAASVRSQQNMDSSGSPGGARGASPGALTNQPPPQPTAPLTGPLAADNEARQLSAPTSAGGSDAAERRESTINYEVDRAIEVLKANKGQVKRVSAAVVVNYKPAIVKNGVVETPAAPYSPEELQQMTNIIRDAVGYNEKRGDTVSVANIPFASEAVEVLPFYRQPEMIELGKELIKYGLVLIALLLLYRSVRNLFKPEEPVKVAPVIEAVIEPEPEPEPEDPAIVAAREAVELERIRMEQEKERIAKLEKDYEELSAYTIEYVKNNPQVIGTLLKNWRAPKREENTAESNAPFNGFKPEGFA